MEKNELDTSKVTRVEVIDDKGRSYVNWNSRNRTYVQLQDEGRTLKVFVYAEPHDRSHLPANERDCHNIVG